MASRRRTLNSGTVHQLRDGPSGQGPSESTHTNPYHLPFSLLDLTVRSTRCNGMAIYKQPSPSTVRIRETKRPYEHYELHPHRLETTEPHFFTLPPSLLGPSGPG